MRIEMAKTLASLYNAVVWPFSGKRAEVWPTDIVSIGGKKGEVLTGTGDLVKEIVRERAESAWRVSGYARITFTRRN